MYERYQVVRDAFYQLNAKIQKLQESMPRLSMNDV